MKKILTILMTIMTIVTTAQTPKKKLDKALASYFNGEWHGEGQFANGKKISARLRFEFSLDSSWLVNHHEDRIPNKYRADSYWGLNPATGKLMAVIFDNFGGYRVFNGTYADSLVLARSAATAQGNKYFEHFIYRKLDANSFKMSYETSRDSIQWRESDHLIFKKKTDG